MSEGFAQQTAVVTGGGSGVGAAIATALAAAGARVVITGRNQNALAALSARHPGMMTAVCDVTDAAAVSRLFADLAARGVSPTIIVANAGAAESAPIARTDAALWQRMIDVNLTGVFNTFRAALAVLPKGTPARLVAVASTAGLKGYPYVSAYCAAKHGVVGLVRALAIELARTPVTVNAVCPGFVDTPMLERSIADIVASTGQPPDAVRSKLAATSPQGRFITPEEVAGAVLWLCSNAAASVTGETVSISGGEI